MKTLHRFALLPLPMLVLCPVRADFNPATVASDAQWVVAVDVNQLRESSLGKGLLDILQRRLAPSAAENGQIAGGAQGDLPSGFSVGAVQLNFLKLSEMIDTITAYGSNFSRDPKLIDGVLVLRGTADLRKIAEAAAIQGNVAMPDRVKELKDMPFEAYEIGGEVIIAFPPEPVILVSKSRSQLIKARDVARGVAPSLAQTPSTPLAGLLASPGHPFVTVASAIPAEQLFPANGPQARLLQLVDSGMVTLGEDEPKTVAYLKLVATSTDTADKLLKIVQGMVAMASLAETTDNDLKAFLESAMVESKDRAVILHLSYPSARIIQMAQTLQNRTNPPPPGPPAPPRDPVAPGLVGAEWTLGQAAPGAVAGADLRAEHAVEDVRLVNGATISLTGRRDRSGAAIFDDVEITPASGAGPALRFEAENMRLQRYRVMNAPYASHGKVIALNGSYGVAQFEFPGEDGNYRIRVRYLEQPPGKTTMSVTVRNPNPEPAAK